MISKMSDEEAIEMLMTSEFEDNYPPFEYKDMLLKYRYFYRILHARMERLVGDRDFDISRLGEMLEEEKKRSLMFEQMAVRSQEELKQYKNRKLSLRERLTGKIISDDEN
jgi:hypothetical protein